MSGWPRDVLALAVLIWLFLGVGQRKKLIAEYLECRQANPADICLAKALRP